MVSGLQWAPGLDDYRWMPEDLTQLLPALLRGGSAPEAIPEIEGEVDDEALVAMAPLTPPSPNAQTDQTPDVDGPDPVDPDEPPLDEAAEERFIVESNQKLPPHPTRGKLKSGLPFLPIEDPQFGLRLFYRSLQRTENKDFGSITRVVHYGDSLLTGDMVTQTARRLMQKKFGDAGHGFVLAGRPAPWYRRNNLTTHYSKGWDVNRITRPTVKDGRYGMGGVTFHTSKVGQWVKAEPKGQTLGAAVSKFQVFYLAQPRGGKFSMKVDGRGVEINTRNAETGTRLAEIVVPDGPHTFRIKTQGRGQVRLFGMVLERDGPGVVYDSLGLDGARAKLLKRINPEHWHRQLRLRKPDLLVLHYGTNESQWVNLSARKYRADLAQTVGHLRAALPGVSCLLVGPMDRAQRGAGGKLVTRPVIKRILDVQRRVAYDQGCAFWNTFRAMGGEGSMAKWYKARPQLAQGDLTHPTRKGADRIGAMLFAALMDGYGRFKRGEYR